MSFDALGAILSLAGGVAAAVVLTLVRPPGRRPLVLLPVAVLALSSLALVVRQTPPLAVLLVELALLAAAPLLWSGRDGRSRLHRYVAAIAVGGAVLFLGQAFADLYYVVRDQHLSRLSIACFFVGFGMLAGIFPFQHWLTSALRGGSLPLAAALLAVARPVVTGVFLAMALGAPALLADRQMLAPVQWALAISVLATALLAMAQRRPMSAILYLCTADLAFAFAGAASGSIAGFTAALLATLNHALGVALLLASLALLESKVLVPGRTMAKLGFLVALLSLSGTPPAAGFLYRIAILRTVWEQSQPIFGLLLAAEALLFVVTCRLVYDVSWAPSARAAEAVVHSDCGASEDRQSLRLASGAIAGGILLIVALSLYPAPLIAASWSAVAALGLPPP